MNLSTKVFVALAPLFFIAVALSVYFSYRYQEKLILREAQNSARARASIIRESLVHQMVTNLRVDDKFLAQLNKLGGVENLHILFSFDSLRLRQTVVTPGLVDRLQRREADLRKVSPSLVLQAYEDRSTRWYLSCETGEHTDRAISGSAGIEPMWIPSCERLTVLLPFTSELRCQQCHDVPQGDVIGAAYLQMPLRATISALHDNALRSILIFLLFTLVAIVLGALIFRHFVSRPVHTLVESAEAIGAGNFSLHLRDKFDRDEFGKLADSFERMQERLKTTQEELIHKERLSTVGQMASSIIHDFRNPMTSISLGIDILRTAHNLSEARREELFEHVRASLNLMNRMTQELLDFSRGEIKLEQEYHEIADFVSRIEQAVGAHIMKKGIQFTVRQEFNGQLFFDRDRLERAIINILNNAEDATSPGGTIWLVTRQEGERVVFEIGDSGAGVPADVRERIFEPFVTAGKKQGTGLGLAIAKRIIEQHGGEITFETHTGRGTVFTIKIPVPAERDPSARKAHADKH